MVVIAVVVIGWCSGEEEEDIVIVPSVFTSPPLDSVEGGAGAWAGLGEVPSPPLLLLLTVSKFDGVVVLATNVGGVAAAVVGGGSGNSAGGSAGFVSVEEAGMESEELEPLLTADGVSDNKLLLSAGSEFATFVSIGHTTAGDLGLTVGGEGWEFGMGETELVDVVVKAAVVEFSAALVGGLLDCPDTVDGGKAVLLDLPPLCGGIGPEGPNEPGPILLVTGLWDILLGI